MSTANYSAESWSEDDSPGHYERARHGCRSGQLPPTCGGSFTCGRCGRLVGWCLGAADNYPNECDQCANRLHADAERAEKAGTVDH